MVDVVRAESGAEAADLGVSPFSVLHPATTIKLITQAAAKRISTLSHDP